MSDIPADLTGVRSLGEDEIEQAAGVMVRAFISYPVWTWLVPDEVRRAALLPPYALMTMRWGRLLGATYVAGRPVAGVAVWRPPGANESVDPDGSLTGWRAWNAEAGSDVFARLQALNEAQAPARAAACDGPHWYLPWLGVDPRSQRRGVGAALLRHVFARADAAGVPCLLETEVERNVAWYERHGFIVTHAGVVPDGGPPFWTMLRPAR